MYRSNFSNTSAGNGPVQSAAPGTPNRGLRHRKHLSESNGNTGLSSQNLGGASKTLLPGQENSPCRNQSKTTSPFKSLLDKDKIKSKISSKSGESSRLKKSKSTTSLSSILSKAMPSKDNKDDSSSQDPYKENQTPPETPIWAQFARVDATPTMASPQKVPLNDGHGSTTTCDEQLGPQDVSTEHQVVAGKATLSSRIQAKVRAQQQSLGNNGQDAQSSIAYAARPAQGQTLRGSSPSKRGSRVMAAVAALNSKSKEKDREIQSTVQESSVPVDIDAAFESLLEARNVPWNTRDKMRCLDATIKADFIQKNSINFGVASPEKKSATSERSRSASRRGECRGDSSARPLDDAFETQAEASNGKKSRPRSRNFTLGRSGESPTKKQKSERGTSHARSKSGELRTSRSTRSLVTPDASTNGALKLFGRVTPFITPTDCIAYLRKVQEPQDVEVGKIQKLRQLLRNETVEWVNAFIIEGGMQEMLDLLDRIIKVEWREEHEDALLHETLACLKALSTTSLALEHLTAVHNLLFPQLLGLLFSADKKGPSEFTTRTIIMTLLSTYLSSAPSPDIVSRSKLLLSYLEDPAKPENAQPLGFISTMHHSRPYRIWSKELNDVTKEVFWIFLHHVNVIPFPNIPENTSGATDDYLTRHYPRPHPPIPTAPYVGGVEWEATTYLCSHLDLLNAIIASLPTCGERNGLRQELKDSGFEKVMGTSLRTCKEKFYGNVHLALSTWVGAAQEDGWDFRGVREGAIPQNTTLSSPRKTPAKGKSGFEAAPVLEMPKLDFAGIVSDRVDDGGWL